jgi:hypothetical protein
MCFEQHYIDHHVYPALYQPHDCQISEIDDGQISENDDSQISEPGGLDNLRQHLLQPRPSLLLSPSDFRKFQRKNLASKEHKVMEYVIPMIAGISDIPNQQDQLLTGLNSMTDSVTVTPKPDFYDGARLQDLDKSIQEELGPFIVPTKHEWAPVVPNFFLEVKGLGGSPAVAILQALQNGALGARAMHSLQSYSKGKPVYDGNAYTITTTYQNGHLVMYTTHPTPGKDGISPEYHMTLVRALYLLEEQHNAFILATNK